MYFYGAASSTDVNWQQYNGEEISINCNVINISIFNKNIQVNFVQYFTTGTIVQVSTLVLHSYLF